LKDRSPTTIENRSLATIKKTDFQRRWTLYLYFIDCFAHGSTINIECNDAILYSWYMDGWMFPISRLVYFQLRWRIPYLIDISFNIMSHLCTIFNTPFYISFILTMLLLMRLCFLEITKPTFWIGTTAMSNIRLCYGTSTKQRVEETDPTYGYLAWGMFTWVSYVNIWWCHFVLTLVCEYLVNCFEVLYFILNFWS